MPTGLVVNELLTNTLKHAFRSRDGGIITLHSVVDANGCTVMVADDGVGLPEGTTWPTPGRLGALIAESLKRNAHAHFEVTSGTATGTAVTITFGSVGAVAELSSIDARSVGARALDRPPILETTRKS